MFCAHLYARFCKRKRIESKMNNEQRKEFTIKTISKHNEKHINNNQQWNCQNPDTNKADMPVFKVR